MLARHGRRHTSAGSAKATAAVESLESRTLLSLTSGPVLHSDLSVLRYAATTASIPGYAPGQIRHAYGFDQLGFDNGSIAADGRSQTIAIVDAYNDPNIAGDLSVFDQQFGIAAPPALEVVNQSGGTSLPQADSGWAGEIALDVEWAHAMAPAAGLLVVEAASAAVSDLMAAVNYARHALGVCTVSMSWGGSEFFSWGGGEFASQTDYDPFFSTPAGHPGVTFIAAAGDSGSFGGVQWPASSPNVLSVGGTKLSVADPNGTYGGESSWSGTSGGFSQVEVEPAYQQTAQSSGVRTTPDVAYNADPNTGFAVYDSVPQQGQSGWLEVGGTSAGAPQWAGLVAIADQGRALSGLGSLDGATQTLPVLYSLYTATNSNGAPTYAADFHDVVDSGGNGGWRFRWGWGYNSNPATAGYDLATGLGTPVAADVVSALADLTAGGDSPVGIQQLPASPLIGAFRNGLPAHAIAPGHRGHLRLRLTNTATTRFAGTIAITLYASRDTHLSSDDTFLVTRSLARVHLAGGASRPARLKFTFPATLPDGSYFVVASIDATDTATSPAIAATAAPVTVTAFATSVRASASVIASSSASATVAQMGASFTDQSVIGVELSGRDAGAWAPGFSATFGSAPLDELALDVRARPGGVQGTSNEPRVI